MLKQIDNLIESLLHEADTVKHNVDIEFNNLYKHDKDFKYTILKKDKEVMVNYKGILYGFTLPVISVGLMPTATYAFFKKKYVYEMIDTFKLDYSLSMYYVICLHIYSKTQLNINFETN